MNFLLIADCGRTFDDFGFPSQADIPGPIVNLAITGSSIIPDWDTLPPRLRS